MIARPCPQGVERGCGRLGFSDVDRLARQIAQGHKPSDSLVGWRMRTHQRRYGRAPSGQENRFPRPALIGFNLVQGTCQPLRIAGEREEVERFTRELVKMEKRAELHRSRVEFEQHHVLEEAKLAFELQELELQLEERVAAGEEIEVGELLKRKLEAKLRALQLEAMKKQLDQSMAELEIEMMELEDAKTAEQ